MRDEEILHEFEITFIYDRKELNAFVEYRLTQFILNAETRYTYAVYMDNPWKLFDFKEDDGELTYTGSDDPELAEAIKSALDAHIKKSPIN